jgi:glycosyltransferase involved in cell wall biosynthesis
VGRPIRVLHIVDSLSGGGAERWIHDIVRLTDPRHLIHRVVTATPEGPGFVFADRLHAAGVYTRQPIGPLLDAMPLRGTRALCAALGGDTALPRTLTGCIRVAAEYLRFRPDVVHAHGFDGLGLGAWLTSWTRRPLAYSLWCRLTQLRDAGADWVIDDYRRWHHRAAVFLADPAYAPELQEIGVPAHKIETFVGSVDVAATEEVAAAAPRLRLEVRERLGIPADAPIALSVGRMIRSKGHQLAIDAVQIARGRLAGLHWVVLGDGPQRAELESHAAVRGLGNSAHFIGRVEDPHPFYAAADIFLRTPLLEGENTSSQDAMAFALPVAGFDTGCGTDVVPRTGHGICVPPGDVVGLSTAITDILSSPDRGRCLGRRGQEYARQHFDIVKSIELFARTYQRLAREPQ